MKYLSSYIHWRQKNIYTYNEKTPHNTLYWKTSGLILLLVIIIIRSWTNITHPAFHVEDSEHYFNLYYGGKQAFTTILSHPHGYYNIFNNLAAFLIAKADITLQPFLYLYTALFCGFITVAAFSFSGLIRNKYILFFGPLLLGLSGMNHILYYISITFQMYVLVVLAITLLFYRKKPASSITKFLFFLLMSFLIWAGPYSVLVVPFSIIYILVFRDNTKLFLALSIVTILYALSARSGTILLQNIFDPEIIGLWIKSLILHIFFMDLTHTLTLAKGIFVVLFFLLIYGLLRKDQFFLKTSLLFFTIIVANYAPYILSNKLYIWSSLFPEKYVFFPCHKFIGQYFWCCFLLFAADRILMRYKSVNKVFIPIFAVLIIIFIIKDNSRYTKKYSYQIPPKSHDFILEIKEQEKNREELIKNHQQIIVITKGTVGIKIIAKIGDQTKGAKVIKKIFVE